MTMSLLRRTAATAVAVGAVTALAAAPGAQAAPAGNPVADGQTTLKLDAATAKVLKRNRIAVAPLAPASSGAAGVSFPAASKGSSLDPTSYAGTLNHTGGLRISAGGKTLRLTKFRVSVGSSSTLNAQINGGARATIISLDLKQAKVTQDGPSTTAGGIVARLNAAGAKALNRYFDVRLFADGLKLGAITSRSTFAATGPVIAKATDLHAAWAQRFNAGDLDGMLALAEPGSAFVPQPGVVTVGANYRAALEQFLALKLPISLTLRRSVVSGDVALLIYDWKINGTAANGAPINLSGTTSDVARKGSRGWRFVIDNPFGVV